MRVDAVIFGGGVAGLWLLDELVRRGRSAVLLEAHELGRGQTVASQGILHGGLKYTLQGLLTSSAAAIRDMPLVWRDCLAGRREPDLSATRVRSHHCYLWRTDSLSSRMGMLGAKLGLRVAPESLADHDRPAVLARCPGTVARLEEQVIAPDSLIANLAQRHHTRILKIEPTCGLDFELDAPGSVRTIRLAMPVPGCGKQMLVLEPQNVILTAGEGNAALRARLSLGTAVMQKRPLHMVLVRGSLPVLNGHCVDGSTTRVTITSDPGADGRTVWQVGGQIAEDGVGLEPQDLIARAQVELTAAIPGLNLDGTEWATYRVNRAEGAVPGGKRPDTLQIRRDGRTLTAWPTKLVLAPQLATEIADRIESAHFVGGHLSLPDEWPRPAVAAPPWVSATIWPPSSSAGRVPCSRAA